MNLGTVGNAAATIGFGAVGGYFYGYPGMMMGMSIAGMLFHGDEAKEHIAYNTAVKDTRLISKPDIVPGLIGTDICPGNVIWLGEGTPLTVSPSFYENEGLNEWYKSIQPDSMGFFGMGSSDSDKIGLQFCHISFVLSFAHSKSTPYISRMWLQKIHHWAWLRFDDFIHTYYGWFETGWAPISEFVFNAYYTLDDLPIKSIADAHFWGALTLPQSQSLIMNSFYNYPEQYRPYSVIGSMPTSFPDVKAEVTRGVDFSPFGGYMSDRTHSGYTHTYRDNNSHYLYGLVDAESDVGEPWYGVPVSFRRLNFYEYTYSELTTPSNFFYNISKGYHDGQSISRQDIDGNPDHLYIVHGRNWYDGGKVNHHHAEYSLEYDIFYLDRSDDTLYSVCKDQQISIAGMDSDSNAIPRIQIRSMEIVGNSILLFGNEWQSHSIWGDSRQLTADPEILPGKQTKIYADFSQYPDDYWTDTTGGVYVWAYFQWEPSGGNVDYRERYRIVSQTSTYIIVDGVFALVSTGRITSDGLTEGNHYPKIYFTRVRSYQAGWAIVGEGSTKNTIIANYPSPYDTLPNISTLPYDSCIFSDSNTDGPSDNWGYEIDSASGTQINLVTSLTNDPIPGEVIWFSHEFFLDGIAYPDDKDNFERFYDPINYWFMESLEELICPDWLTNTGYFCSDFYVYNHYYNNGLSNSNNWGKSVILKFNKTTGAYEGKIYEHNPVPYQYTGIQFIAVNESCQISTVSTDAQIACSFQNAQPYAVLFAINLVINKSTLGIESDWIGRHSEGNVSHAIGKIYRGAVKVRAYDDISNTYSNRWYALVAEFMAADRRLLTYDNTNIGYYILDLGLTGIFPDADKPIMPGESEEYSALLNIDASAPQMVKWFRPQLATGPLYSPFFLDLSTIRDSMSLRMYDYDEKLFFSVDRGSYVGEMSETWCYMMPNEYNRYGFSWPVSMSSKYWATGDDNWGDIIRSCKYYLGMGAYSTNNHFSNYVDQVIDSSIGFIAESDYIIMPSTEQNYANEIIDDIVIYNSKEHEIKERRFLYSRCWDECTPKDDILNDILATCQGFLVPRCSGTYQTKVKLPKPDETPDWFFGYDENTFTITSLGSTTSRIYLDLSVYPDNYWMGDDGVLIQNGNDYLFSVESSTTNYIDLLATITVTPQQGDSVKLIKDNILESSFTYSKKPQYDRANRVRVEFINRLLEYKIDISEADDHYKQDVLDKCVIVKQLELHGIKRASQAARMALRYLDYEQYVNWLCSFQTDVLGHYMCVGDIIGVTHPITGWVAKYFRIVRKEETEDFETMIECEEYVSSIYHDYSNPVYQGGGSTPISLPITDTPEPVRRLSAYYDQINNRIYVSFYSPGSSANVVGANVYAKVGSNDYHKIGFATTASASVIYSEYPGTTTTSDMEPTRTKFKEINELGYQYCEIPYDPLTMLGTFPATGYLWINGELIYYNGMDTTNYKFINCVRCIEVPEYQYAADAPDDGLNWTNPLIVLADFSNQFHFNPSDNWVDLTAEASQTEGSQIEYDIPTLTVKLVAVNIMGVESYGGTSPTFEIKLRSAMGRPYSPALLRYERDL